MGLQAKRLSYLATLLLGLGLGLPSLWAQEPGPEDVPQGDAAQEPELDLSVPMPSSMDGTTNDTGREGSSEEEEQAREEEPPLFEPVGRPWTPPEERHDSGDEPPPSDTVPEPMLTDEQWKEYREAELERAGEEGEPNPIYAWQYPHPLTLPSPLALSYLSLGLDYSSQGATKYSQQMDGTFLEQNLSVTQMTLSPSVRYAVIPQTLELGGEIGFTFLSGDAPTWFVFHDFQFTGKYVAYNSEPFVVALGLDLDLGNLSYNQVFQPDYLELNPYLTFGVYWKWLTLQPFVGFGYVADLQESNDVRIDPDSGYILALGDRFFPRRDMNDFYDDSPMRLDLGLMISLALDEQWYVGVETDTDLWLTPEVDPWSWAGPVFGYNSLEYTVRAGAMIPLTHQDEQFIFQPMFLVGLRF